MRTPSWDRAVLEAKRLCAAVRRRECGVYLFADGFDNYNTASEMYETVVGSVTYSSATRRFAPPSGLPGQGVTFGSNNYIRKNLVANRTTLIVKAAVYFPSVGGAISTGGGFLTLWDAGTYQCSLVLFPSGAVGILLGAISTLQVQSGPGVIASAQWYGIELEVTIGTGSGSASLWVNGFLVFTITGINTQVSANAYANQVSIGDMFNRLGGITMSADDFRIWDNTGSTQNAPLAIDSRIVTKLPSGAGSFAQFTPNGAAANWQCTDDNPPDDDSTYVSGATVGLTDSYAMPGAGFTQAPAMVVSRARARKDDSATRQLETGVLSGGVSIGTTSTLGSTYAFIDCCVPVDPATAVAWTAAGADGAQHWKQEIA